MKFNLLNDSDFFNTKITNYLVRLVGLKRITKKFWYRWLAHGADYGDIVTVMSKVKTFEQWLDEWNALAIKYEESAKESVGLSAQNFYLKASVYYYLAQWAVFDVTKQKKEAYIKSKECFLEANKTLQVPVREVFFDYNGQKCPGYLRIPGNKEKTPCVIFVHGMDSAKEEVYWTEKEAVERGVASFYFDGPGQGELYIMNEVLWKEDFDDVITKAIDYVSSIPEIDNDNIFICGMSWGGYWALKMASKDKRIKACCSLGGPPSSKHFSTLPIPIQMRFRKLFNKENESVNSEYAQSIFNKMNLDDDIQNIKCPTLIIHGKKDPLVPYALVEEMVDKLRCDKTFKVYEDGDHCCTQYANEVRNLAADWMVKKLIV